MEAPDVTYRLAGGRVEVDPRCQIVRRGDDESHLRSQSFRVLLYLLEHRRGIVLHDELFDAIWPGTAVTPDALVQCIVDIRRALGDDAREPRFVRTVKGRGYVFIAEVEEVPVPRRVDTDEAVAALPDRASGRGRPVFRDGRAFGAIAGSVVAGFTAAALLLLADTGSQRLGANAEDATVQDVRSPCVVVVPFEDRSPAGDLGWLGESAADMVATTLSGEVSVKIAPRGVEATSCGRSSASLAPDRAHSEFERGESRPADVLLSGSITRLGAEVRIDAHLHDGTTGILVGAESVTARYPDRVLDELDALSRRITGRWNTALPDAPRATR